MAKNILFLLVDQWPAACFGHLGADIETPNIDKLASQGTEFTNAFTTCPLCSPARGGLLTSRWHTQTGMMDNLNVGYSIQAPLDMSEPTWLDAAVANGYHTGYYGKWHLGEDGPKLRGVHGHPESTEKGHIKRQVKDIVYNYQDCRQGYLEEERRLKSGKAPFYGTTDESIEASNPYKVVNEAKMFIDHYMDANVDKPFLLTVSINDPHFPHYLPEALVKGYDQSDLELPISIIDDFNDKPWFHNKSWWPSMDTSALTKDEWKEVVKYAYRHRMLVDQALGDMIDTIESYGLKDDTTIIFTSDHGDMCGAHNRFDKGPYYYDEVWRIPLIIYEPGKQAALQDAMVSTLDIGRTVFDLLGYEYLASQGRNLWPLVGGESSPKHWQQKVYGMYDLYNGMSFKIRAIRNRTYKYIYNPQSIDEFYDLKNDPFELTNLISWVKVEEKKVAMKNQLFKWMRSIKDPLLEEVASLPEAGTIIISGKAGP